MQTDPQLSSTPPAEEASISPYPQPTGAYDEAFDSQRQPRAHWQYLLDSVLGLGEEELLDRQRRVQRILRDDGATYNLSSDPLSPDTWSLDVLPHLIPSEEWRQIELGLAQRSELFDLVLKDIYGPQELIKSGTLPAEILFGHSGFLRQCHGVEVPGPHHLIMHAVDLVKGPDGQMCVVGDRTQSPNGAGYALENRTVLSRVIPSIFRDSHVHRLSRFFQTFRTSLSKLMLDRTDSPRIVLLTPGAYSSSYFEQAYLANYLGLPLVQGSDLTVRNGYVWMKTLQGLSRVDVILRRVEDSYCDQAELRPDSLLGVPGLLEIVREGNVVLANPLGAGILEAPAFLKYLPAISQFFLGKQLQLPSVGTWWCGDKEDLSFVLTNLRQLIIKPASRRHGASSIYGHTLTDAELKKVTAMITSQPHYYSAQSYLPGSHLPTRQSNQLSSRPTILRTFTVSDQNSYAVMPGGLSRVAMSDQENIVSNLSGYQSKDTWILASEPEKANPVSADRLNPQELEQQGNLPSRVIENLFWMGRYAERAEISMRLLRTFFKQMNGLDPLPEESRNMLLQAISIQTGCLPGFSDEDSPSFDQPEAELASLISDGDRLGSVKSNLEAMLTCCEQAKEMLSADTRIIINDLRDHLYHLDRVYINGLPSAPEESLDNLVTCLLALAGLSHESMLRGQDWVFQEIGRRTERALQTITLLRSTLTVPLPSMLQQQILESVLLSVEALISFRRRYRSRPRVAYGLELLMVDETNPRSLFYQIEQLRKCFTQLPRSDKASFGLSPENRLIIQSLNDVQLADLERLAEVDEESGTRLHLEQLMERLQDQLERLTVLISDTYFDHTTVPHALNNTSWDDAL